MLKLDTTVTATWLFFEWLTAAGRCGVRRSAPKRLPTISIATRVGRRSWLVIKFTGNEFTTLRSELLHVRLMF